MLSDVSNVDPQDKTRIFLKRCFLRTVFIASLQDISDSWLDTIPEVVSNIKHEGQIGDFVAAMGRSNRDDKKLMDLYGKYFSR